MKNRKRKPTQVVSLLIPIVGIMLSISTSGCNEEFRVVYNPIDSVDFEMFKEIPDNDTVLLVLPDGLNPNLDLDMESATKFAFFPYNIAVVHHAQTKDPSLSRQYYMTLKEAAEINEISADILNRTIDHFKSKGRFVIVFGDSFGSFLSLKTIQLYGTKADVYVHLNGRLDVEEEILSVATDLKFPAIEGQQSQVSSYMISRENWVDFRLLVSIATPRYSEVLASIDWSRVLCTYREEKDILEKLSLEEIDFLVSQGATVEGFPGDQDWSGYEFYTLLDFISDL